MREQTAEAEEKVSSIEKAEEYLRRRKYICMFGYGGRWRARLRAAVIFVTLSALLLSGCSRNGRRDGTRKIRIGFASYDQNDTFISTVVDKLKEYVKGAEKNDFSLEIRDAAGSARTQEDQVMELINMGCNVLCVNLVDRADPSQIIDAARSRDVPIIFFNREPVPEDMYQWDKIYYVGADAAQSGVMQGELAADYILANPDVDKNKDGTIQYVVLEGEPGHQDAIIRTEKSVDTIKQKGVKLEKLSYQIANWNRAQAQNRMVQLIAEHRSNIELVLANNDDMALGAIDAYRSINYSESALPVFFGVDGTPAGLQAIVDGRLKGTVYNDKVGQAIMIMHLSAAAVSGTAPEGVKMKDGKYVYVPYSKITEENVRYYMESVP